ncbi:MAG: type I DNA topoisomerase [Gemmataceae bacterium]|nr:type I DNA topoisomerase [Gemmataceae bacterium]MDW8264843.1 type I DNA topoisomerase [Gemmataceae bacterium]
MPARKKKHLVIVESPAKAKTIHKYLGPEYEVVASKGHVRDLPKTRFGIDIDAGWVPTYRPLEDRKPILEALKKQAAQADTVYLAPDPDREGEAIAWHLKEALGLPDERVRRVTFNEITKRAVQEAFAHPGQIDMDRVMAQEARRFLDRIVGYKLSPLLSRKLAQHLSAGRVQSVAVRLIVEREREIQNFKPEEYWKITATLAPEGTVSLRAVKKGRGKKKEAEAPAAELPPGAFRAELAEWAGAKFHAGNAEEAQRVVAALEGASYVVAKVEQKDKPEKAPPPFTTSTLQQQASVRLRFSAKKTMMLAQQLYEGVELGSEGSVGLITYMRTDSTRVSGEALSSVRQLIRERFGPDYLPEKPNVFASGKSAQEAHEAIRPTDLSWTPERVAPFLSPDQQRLYALIYHRFVASQMTPAIFSLTNVDIRAGDGLFKAQGKVLKFDGYRRVLAPVGKQEDALLPELTEQQRLDLLQLTPTQHFTQPPPRYNEASLIKTLEKEGIGRPSTYATIITKIQERGYVEQKNRRFYATDIGMTVTDLLVEHFPKVMDLKFTSHMEEELDQIEAHQLKRNDVLTEFYEPFAAALKVAEEKMQTEAEKCPRCGKPIVERFSKAGKFFGCSGYPECTFIRRKNGDDKPREAPVVTEHTCPNCGKPMVQRLGRRGPFLGCSGYPECKTTMNLDSEGKPVLASKPTEHICDKCGAAMVLREGPRGPFLACSAYPKCRNAKDVDAEGNPIQPIDAGEPCDKCGAPMQVKRGPRGPFLGCSAYPKCRRTKPVPNELKEKLTALMPAPVKKAVPAVEVSETCPECGAPMKLRPSRRGFFLGCSKYPKCRGTREASPELLEGVS